MSGLTFFTVTGDYQAVDDVEPSSVTSDANVEAVQGLVMFRARVPQGFVAYYDEFDISQDANCQQIVTVIGAVTGGTFALNFDGVWTDPGIAPGATPAGVQLALEALETIGTGNVAVTGANGGPWTVEFVGALANAPQTQMIADASQLDVSSGSPHVSVSTSQPGATERVGDTAIALPPRHGRIWTTGQLCSINKEDSPGVELTANANLGIEFDLIYDVSFTKVYFNDDNRTLAPFAFVAPTDDTPVCITDPALERLPFSAPIQETWYPGWVPPPYVTPGSLVSVPNWRQRSA